MSSFIMRANGIASAGGFVASAGTLDECLAEWGSSYVRSTGANQTCYMTMDDMPANVVGVGASCTVYSSTCRGCASCNYIRGCMSVPGHGTAADSSYRGTPLCPSYATWAFATALPGGGAWDRDTANLVTCGVQVNSATTNNDTKCNGQYIAWTITQAGGGYTFPDGVGAILVGMASLVSGLSRVSDIFALRKAQNDLEMRKLRPTHFLTPDDDESVLRFLREQRFPAHFDMRRAA
jgi:hypothetical protein